MPHAGRTARAPRVAPAVRTVAGLALLLPLLAVAFLAALWFLGTAPAHALDTDRVGQAPLGSEEGTLRDVSVKEVVPAEITEPVGATIDTVHQSLATEPRADASLSETALPEVRDGARQVIEKIDRPTSDEHGLVGALGAQGTLGPVNPDHDPSGDAGDRSTDVRKSDRSVTDEREDPDEDDRGEAESAEPPTVHADDVVDDLFHTPVRAAAESNPTHSDGPFLEEEPRTVTVVPSSSAPTGGSGVSAVAGYLSVVPAAGPATFGLRHSPHRPHALPTDATDDPTFSPD